MSINNVGNSLANNAVSNSLGKMLKAATSKENCVGRFVHDTFIKNDGRLATGAAATIFSVIAKDIVGCVFYVYQSLTNKEIPEDKRGFVAALDFANGAMNLVGQLALVPVLDFVGGKIFDGVLSGNMLADAKNTASDALKTRQGLKAGWKLLFSLAMCQIFAKRVITPLFATPMAGKIKDHYKIKDIEKQLAEGKELQSKDVLFYGNVLDEKVKAGKKLTAAQQAFLDKNPAETRVAVAKAEGSEKSEKTEKAESAPETKKAEQPEKSEKVDSKADEKVETKPAETFAAKLPKEPEFEKNADKNINNIKNEQDEILKNLKV